MSNYIELVISIGAPLYIMAVVLYTIRLIRGPTIPDMVLAADCLAYDLAVFLAALSLYYRTPFMVAPPIMLALWAYILDIYVSKYLVAKEVGV
ncbi:MAG: monovalent cation/H+ antiporter complex subunit F [Desulfurococcaceae archaeon]|jgi:multicomponent Na+:H+ antiporter subunit F